MLAWFLDLFWPFQMVSCIFPNPYACKEAFGSKKSNKKIWPQNRLPPPSETTVQLLNSVWTYFAALKLTRQLVPASEWCLDWKGTFQGIVCICICVTLFSFVKNVLSYDKQTGRLWTKEVGKVGWADADTALLLDPFALPLPEKKLIKQKKN